MNTEERLSEGHRRSADRWRSDTGCVLSAVRDRQDQVEKPV